MTYFIVSIARATLKNAQILLMDEATSALDTGTEREIQGQLRKLVRLAHPISLSLLKVICLD